MSLLVVGLSHRSASMDVLESVALAPDRAAALASAVHGAESVAEAVVVATCNRVEVYADAVTFHGAVAEIGEALSRASSVPLDQLHDQLYVHYEDRAIAHLFSVACGLDSMAVGESQVLGQLRQALRRAQEQQSTATVLNALFQQALRVGKRAHSETDIDHVSGSLLAVALERATHHLGPARRQHVLVVGAGSMSSLAAVTVARHGMAQLVVINRTLATGQRLAEATGGVARPWDELTQALPDADLVISCTGAVGHIVGRDDVLAAQVEREHRPQVYVDLALPRDVDPAAGTIPGVTIVGLAELGRSLAAADTQPQIKAVQELVITEVAAYLTGRRAKSVAPTVAALRARAADVVAAELTRLEHRLPELGAEQRAEVQLTMHRVVEKLLHAPTVRVKELAMTGGGGDYEQALRELFDLDPHDVAAVSVPPDTGARA